MATKSSYYVVMYDITHPRTLQKVAKILLQCGMERINLSVWLGWVNPAKQPELKERLTKLVTNEKAKGSLLYILPVSAKDIRQMRSITGRKPRELDYWIGEKTTLFF